MNICFVGCGYVADFYAATLANHPSLRLIGVCDVDLDRALSLAQMCGVPGSSDIDAWIANPEVEMVVNLTPPEIHSSIIRKAISHGKACYSEKPFVTLFNEGSELVRLATDACVPLAGAPCSMLGEAAQTTWRAIRSGLIGAPRLVYANLDDGAIHKMAFDRWVSPRGIPWPSKNEFFHGCVMEHAAYHLSWLIMMFGPIFRGSTFGASIWPSKRNNEVNPAPDLSVATLEHVSGVISRVTCGVAASRDRSFRVVGDDGEIRVADCWNFMSPVTVSLLRQPLRPGREGSSEYLCDPEEIESNLAPGFSHRCGDKNDMDYCRGVAEFAVAIQKGRSSRVGAQFLLHCLEVQCELNTLGPRTFVTTTADNVPNSVPMPWAL
ncbi:MAG: gfo/Idh/MocA family oxidoreductase [Betaproteobacteria bacterium HGW-Betaproteobacteria-7]|jgi:predicted dehydrogenase|nr:MAG: gfo/Idh/MocA family oxidoreductase [Betaproteobacteria bacterium HGW-Betaproteobacteria-7]